LSNVLEIRISKRKQSLKRRLRGFYKSRITENFSPIQWCLPLISSKGVSKFQKSKGKITRLDKTLVQPKISNLAARVPLKTMGLKVILRLHWSLSTRCHRRSDHKSRNILPSCVELCALKTITTTFITSSFFWTSK
jgi:hypothetical protein